MAREGTDFSAALADAQRLGYAEPDPSKDIDGDDAVEKLCVLLRHFGDFTVPPPQIERRGIRDLDPADPHASAFWRNHPAHRCRLVARHHGHGLCRAGICRD